MRVRLKRIGLALLVLLVLAQLVPVHRTSPPVDAAKTIYATYPVPANVHAIFDRSCKDCHSSETVWPWYSHVAPVSWVVVNDVNQARKHMNFSEWGTYSAQKRLSKFENICEQLRSGDMPDSKYTLIHRKARLSDEERKTLCAWADATRKSLTNTPAVSPAKQPGVALP